MNIEDGFQTDQPPITLSWNTSRHQLLKLNGLKVISDEYLTVEAIVFSGLAVRIGLHLGDDKLCRLEIMRLHDLPLANSYRDFQLRLGAFLVNLTMVFRPMVVSLSSHGSVVKCPLFTQ